MSKLAVFLIAGALAASSSAYSESRPPAAQSSKYWVIDVGLFQGTGDLKDAGVNSGFLGSVNYFFGNGSPKSNAEWYVGLGGLTGEGDDDFKFRAYGLHVGVLVGFGRPGEENPWALDLRGGWYQAHIEYTPVTTGASGVDETESGFGWFAGILYKSKSGPRFSLGLFTSSEVNGERGTGYYFTVGFPVGGK